MKGHSETTPPRDTTHTQTSNQTLLLMPRSVCWQEPGIAVPWKALPEPDQYRCRCLQSNIGLSQGTPNGGVRGRTEGAEGACNPIRRTTISTNQTTHISQGLNHQSKSIHGGTHGSSCMCSRLPYLVSVGGRRTDWILRERLLSGWEHRLLFWRSRIQISATTWWLTTIHSEIWLPFLVHLKTPTVYLDIIINKSLKKRIWSSQLSTDRS